MAQGKERGVPRRRHFSRKPEEGLVALFAGSRMAGVNCQPDTGQRLSRLRGKTVIPGENDFASRYPVLAREWDFEKNGHLTPDAVTGQSNRKVWWKCDLGHSYQAVISSRASDRQGCPYCSGQRVLKGFNDLATLLPKIADQWHPTLNGALTPEEVTCGSAKKVWWKCNVCGYEWKAIIYSRAGAQRCGCPMCAGKVKTRNRERYRSIAAEYSYLINKVKKPAQNIKKGVDRNAERRDNP